MTPKETAMEKLEGIGLSLRYAHLVEKYIDELIKKQAKEFLKDLKDLDNTITLASQNKMMIRLIKKYGDK